VIGVLLALSGCTAAQSDAGVPEARAWKFNASTYTFFLPDAENYANPNFVADRGRLHLEARYNNEALRTGSFWVGVNLGAGERVRLEVTPMIGGVFGELNGVAPGYNASITFDKLDLTTSGELVVDVKDRSGSFFYTWSELGYSPSEWFRGGVVVERTKAYRSSFDIQRGVFAGVTVRRVNVTTYVFNVATRDATTVLAVSVDF
jgi:hypothetical protein